MNPLKQMCGQSLWLDYLKRSLIENGERVTLVERDGLKEAAIEEAVPADVPFSALCARFRSRQKHTCEEKMLSARRFGFGGHVEGNEPIAPPRKPAESQSHPAAHKVAE